MYFLYSVLMGLAALLTSPYWLIQGLRHGKYLSNLSQRLGFSISELEKLSAQHPGSIWIHAVSVGEALSGVTLARRLKDSYPQRPLVVSTTTLTGYALAKERMPFADAVIYFPLDWAFTVRRVLNAVKPAIVIILETEIWPNFLRESSRRKIPVLFVHGLNSDPHIWEDALNAVVGDPVGSGLVASLAQPGGNVTGLSVVSPDVAAKRLGLLREAVPGIRRLAILLDDSNPVNVDETRQVQAAAAALGLEAFPLAIRRAEDIIPAFEGLKDRADALNVVGNPLILSNVIRINILAVGARLPTSYIAREYVQGGGLLAYGPSYVDIYRRAGDFFDKILRGTKPGNIPVEQPTKFDLVINLTTAKALGITIPPILLARADEVIE